MSLTDEIAIWNIAATVVAILSAPIIALWVGGVLQERTARRQQKLQVLSTLLSFRHQPLSPENFKALNIIDVVFANDSEVRDAWTKYYSALNDGALNTNPGASIREEKRRDLLFSIIKCLGFHRKISTVDILRTYMPTAIIEIEHLQMWERIKRREDLRAEFLQKRIGFPDYQPAYYPTVDPPVAPQPPAAPPPSPPAGQQGLGVPPNGSGSPAA